jgi:multidrug resistance efflux pump
MKNGKFGFMVVAVLLAAAVALAILGPLLFGRQPQRPASEAKPFAGGALLSAKGIVESREEVELASRMPAVIAEVRVDEGDAVRKGQPLVLLESGKAQARFDQSAALVKEAQARLREQEAGFRKEEVESGRTRVARAESVYNQANDEFQRLERLYRKDAATRLDRDHAEKQSKVAREELNEARAQMQKLIKGERSEIIDQARASVERDNAELAHSREFLREHTIYSPIDGLVTERLKEPGEAVDVAVPVIRLINPAMMRIRAELEESDVGRVREGSSVEVVTDAYRDKVYRGKVQRVFQDVKRTSQKTFDPMASFDISTQTVHISLDDYSGLKSGMSVTVRFLK